MMPWLKATGVVAGLGSIVCLLAAADHYYTRVFETLVVVGLVIEVIGFIRYTIFGHDGNGYG